MSRMVNSPTGTQRLSQFKTKKYTVMQLSKALFIRADKEYQFKGVAGLFRSEEK